jgi:hypothetical protein
MASTQAAPSRPSPLLPLLAVGTILASAGVTWRHERQLERRLEESSRVEAHRERQLQERLANVQEELDSVRGQLGTALDRVEIADQLALRVERAESDLGAIGSAIEAQAGTLLELEQAQAGFGPDLEQRLADQDERLRSSAENLGSLLENTQRAAAESQARLEQLDERLSSPPDLDGMWQDLVGPVVQLAGDASVGSGVLLPSEPTAEGGYRTYLLTAWHVVRDIQGDPPVLEHPVPTRVYHRDGTTLEHPAHLLRHDPGIDVALLELLTDEPLEFGAALAPRERLAQAQIFETVVAVGCPLGNDPIPTRGDIATCQHEVDGETYWMINAPTYIGNSGGGIFDGETHELLGIFSKIYTHGSLRPTIVPHMGLVTPLTKVYDWLETVGYAGLIPVEGDEIAQPVPAHSDAVSAQ